MSARAATTRQAARLMAGDAPPLVLASASAARRLLLEGAGLAFVAEAAAIDEQEIKASLKAEGASAIQAAETLAELKAQRIAPRHPGALRGDAMDPTHALTVHFTDGSKVSFGFPNQAANAAARQIRFEEFLKSKFLLVIADGVLTAMPVANIKAIQLPVDDKSVEHVQLPAHVIKGATVTRGEL